MKAKHLLLSIAGLTLFAACDPKDTVENPPPPKLEVNQLKISALSTENTYTFNVTANVNWTATVAAGIEWLTIDPASGEGEGDETVTVTVEENTDLEPRSTTITITSVAKEGEEPLTEQVSVEQAAATPPVAHELEVDPSKIEAKDVADTYTIDVTSNSDWTASIGENPEWLTLDPASGTGNGTITVSVEANETTDVRDATITIITVAKAGEATLTKDVTVEQAALATPEHAKTTKFWIVGTGDNKQIWSDEINLPECDKTDFQTADNPEEDDACDCRNNAFVNIDGSDFGFYYSTKYVVKYADNLCPDGWRVPELNDFITLDKNLGGSGAVEQAVDGITRYTSEAWGGNVGGSAVKAYSAANYNVTAPQGVAYYCFLPNDDMPEAQLTYSAAYVLFGVAAAGTGTQVRCVK